MKDNSNLSESSGPNAASSEIEKWIAAQSAALAAADKIAKLASRGVSLRNVQLDGTSKVEE